MAFQGRDDVIWEGCQVKHFGTALNTQNLHNSQPDRAAWAGRGLNNGQCQKQIKWPERAIWRAHYWWLGERYTILYTVCFPMLLHYMYFLGKGLMLGCAWQICWIYIFISPREILCNTWRALKGLELMKAEVLNTLNGRDRPMARGAIYSLSGDSICQCFIIHTL